MKVKKDRIFVIVLAIVGANLGSQIALKAAGIANECLWLSLTDWLLLIANVMAFIGVLWLLRSYKRGRKVEKGKQSNLNPEESEDKEA